MWLLYLYLYRRCSRHILLSASVCLMPCTSLKPVVTHGFPFFFLLFFFFPQHVWISQDSGRIMSGETYCRENVYSSISSVERFSIEGCIFCLPACRGGALLPLMLGPQLFVFLIGFFCEEQESGRTHADVICNQSRKQASEFILGDAHGDSDSVRGTLEPLLYLKPRLNWHETRMTAKSHTARHHSSWVHLGNMHTVTVVLNMWYLSSWHCFFPHKSFTVIVINTVKWS